MCGTPEYIAPEIIDKVGHSQPVDFYALGILIYELLNGAPPFCGDDPFEIFKQTLYNKMKFSSTFDPVAKDLVKKLC